jgi:predicted DNA-binding protein
MPNQRKAGKRQLTLWVDPSEYAALKRLAKETGRTMTNILKERLNAHLKKGPKENTNNLLGN